MNADRFDSRRGAILFTDLVGFTEYNDACGDAAAVGVLDQQHRIVATALDGVADGRVVKELGDGLMLWFERVDDGLVVAGRVLGSIETSRTSGEFPLAIRMGMHLGEVVERGDDFVGHTVNIASRIADLAGPGELLVSEDVVVARDPIANGSFHPIGPTRVKGVGDPIWLHRLAL